MVVGNHTQPVLYYESKEERMKVLGISMGRKNERSDIYCKQALKGVEAAAKAAGKT